VNPQSLLTWYAGQAGRDGYAVPGLDSPQAYQVAEVALSKLAAAAGLTRPQPAEPPQQLTAAPAPPPVDSPTQLLPRYRRGQADPRYAERLYGGGRP
jgi:hypothetical protein